MRNHQVSFELLASSCELLGLEHTTRLILHQLLDIVVLSQMECPVQSRFELIALLGIQY